MVDKPAIQYVVEEAVASGLRDILIVTGRGKRAIEDHFDTNVELENHLKRRGGTQALDELERLMTEVRIAYIRQKEPRGLGDAVLCAESLVGDEAFAVLLGDDIMIDEVPCTRQLRSLHKRLGASVLALQRVATANLSRYGVAVGREVEPGIVRIDDIVEKPSPDEVVSDMATVGRYVLTPAIFRHLRKVSAGTDGELQLTDAIQSLLQEEDVYGLLYGGRRYDVGDKIGWLKATFELALERQEFRDSLRTFFGSNESPLR